MSDILPTLRNLVQKAQALHKEERRIALDSILIVGQLEYWRAAPRFGMSSEAFAGHIGLSPSTYWKRAQVARLIARFPKALAMLKSGETEASHLSLIATKITEANQDILLSGIAGKSKREVELFASRVMPDGHVLAESGEVELKLRLNEGQLAMLDRAREILSAQGKVPTLSEVFTEALALLLEKRDPMRKAERKPTQIESTAATAVVGVASSAKGPVRRRSIPAAIRQSVIHRDAGRCTWNFPNGARCEEQAMLEFDHLIPWSRGGAHSVENLTLRCRSHNAFHAEQDFGQTFMAKWREKPVQTTSATLCRDS